MVVADKIKPTLLIIPCGCHFIHQVAKPADWLWAAAGQGTPQCAQQSAISLLHNSDS